MTARAEVIICLLTVVFASGSQVAEAISIGDHRLRQTYNWLQDSG
jgi:hypothetical protein